MHVKPHGLGDEVMDYFLTAVKDFASWEQEITTSFMCLHKVIMHWDRLPSRTLQLTQPPGPASLSQPLMTQTCRFSGVAYVDGSDLKNEELSVLVSRSRGHRACWLPPTKYPPNPLHFGWVEGWTLLNSQDGSSQEHLQNRMERKGGRGKDSKMETEKKGTAPPARFFLQSDKGCSSYESEQRVSPSSERTLKPLFFCLHTQLVSCSHPLRPLEIPKEPGIGSKSRSVAVYHSP
ncbi:uncharacterized protein LOC123821847 [Phyllostomus hastatus]|uniref:uncharacterized protein LOC123821847 n=1 Tax=Phyllostomus hastatus TaxID=9423 RepID=UPI001E67FA31|nr:uncharacterized protein LOC123821847 [Phyllostomus hastatus]